MLEPGQTSPGSGVSSCVGSGVRPGLAFLGAPGCISGISVSNVRWGVSGAYPGTCVENSCLDWSVTGFADWSPSTGEGNGCGVPLACADWSVFI